MSKTKKMAFGGPAPSGVMTMAPQAQPAGPLAGHPLVQQAIQNRMGPAVRQMAPATMSVAPAVQTMKRGGRIDGAAIRGKTKGKCC